MIRYLISLAFILSSCASAIVIRSQPEATACGAAFGLKIEGYYAGCNDIRILEITRKGNMYVGRAECIKWETP